MSELKAGDIVIKVERETAVVSAILESDRAERVFNLITEGEHTFVAQGCVVHNFTYFRKLRMFWHRYLLPANAAEYETSWQQTENSSWALRLVTKLRPRRAGPSRDTGVQFIKFVMSRS